MIKDVNFYMYKYEFVPFLGEASSHSNKDTLFVILDYIRKLKSEKSQAILIDKNESRTEESPREIFIHNVVYMHKERRIRASMALLRSGRKPKFKPEGTFILQPIDKLGDIVEETHFYIDYSKMALFLCVEYNDNGPKMSDIDHYFRKIAKDHLKIVKSTKGTAYINHKLSDTILKFKNVLNFDFKIDPNLIAQVDTEIGEHYLLGLTTFGSRVKPRYLKVEGLFQIPGKRSSISNPENKQANSFIKKLLTYFQKMPENLDAFNSFQIEFEDLEGKKDTFNLVNDRASFSIPLDKEIDNYKSTELYEMVMPKLDAFIQSNS